MNAMNEYHDLPSFKLKEELHDRECKCKECIGGWEDRNRRWEQRQALQRRVLKVNWETIALAKQCGDEGEVARCRESLKAGMQAEDRRLEIPMESIERRIRTEERANQTRYEQALREGEITEDMLRSWEADAVHNRKWLQFMQREALELMRLRRWWQMMDNCTDGRFYMATIAGGGAPQLCRSECLRCPAKVAKDCNCNKGFSPRPRKVDSDNIQENYARRQLEKRELEVRKAEKKNREEKSRRQRELRGGQQGEEDALNMSY